MVVRGGWVGWGQLAWWARLTCHFDILRLMTRGFDLSRRAGLSLRQSSARTWSQLASHSRGGEVALLGDGTSRDA